MSWVCPYCGKENEQDERIGRREPRCILCGEERITAEELEKKRDRAICDLEKDLEKITERAQYIKEKMFSVQEQIYELESERAGYKEELDEACAEATPLTVELDKWREQTIYYEYNQTLRAFRASNDKTQAKLPFEVVAA